MKDRIKDEVDKLPDNILAEVYDFIKFLEERKEKAILVKSAQDLSATSFQKIWDNEEDAVYDKL
jgi:hypothetical protein